VILVIHTKNFARCGTVELPGSPVPRVGETISLPEKNDFFNDAHELLVHHVTYVLEGQSLVPHVECHVGSGSINRRIILEEDGWL